MSIKTTLGVTLSLAVAVVFVVPLFTNAGHGTTTVSPADMNGWWFHEEIASGSGSFEFGPETAPLGNGSATLTVDDTGRQLLGTFEFRGTRLNEIDTLTYNTYRATGSDALAPSLQIDVDTDVTDDDTSWQGRLVYEPYYTHTVLTGEWQMWDTQDNAPNGNWWFSGSPGDAVCPIGDPCTWSELLTEFPDIGVRDTSATSSGAIQFKAGGPWAGGFEGNVDAFEIEVNGHLHTFDFEPALNSGEIISPEENEVVSGTTTLEAVYDDGDDVNDDDVSWAVREGTCDAGVGTVFGNVDGHSDPYDWDGSSFSALIDTSTTTPGEYCFVFNPHDDAGENDVRLTQNFVIEEVDEDDDDGVEDPTGPETKEDCKDGGWKDFTAPEFKNQGQCVSHVASDGRSTNARNR